MENVINAINSYISGLDWPYILTLILLAHLINREKISTKISKVLRIKTRTRYRVALTGFLFGIVIYFFRGYKLENIECLFHSFVFALVFHKLALEGIMQYLRLTAIRNKNAQSQINSEK